jgi:hypothetical protein
MTEAEWLKATDPTPMLEFLRGPSSTEMMNVNGNQVPFVVYRESRASDRRLRLFAIACCRQLSHLLSENCPTALEVTENYADGRVTEADLNAANSAVGREAMEAFNAAVAVAVEAGRNETQHPGIRAIHGHGAVLATSAAGPVDALNAAENAVAHMPGEGKRAGRRMQSRLLRDLFGLLLFRPVRLDPSWLAWNDRTVVKLAQGIYEERAFDRLPMLADALEEAGCKDADILDYCRGPGPHVRGCWVVDLILGKQ